MLRDQVIHGVGTIAVFDFLTGREVARFKKLTTASWTFGMTTQNVEGGDALDPFESFETARASSVKFTNANFNPSMIELPTGKRSVATLSCPIVEFGEGALIPSSGPYTVTQTHAATAMDGSPRVRFMDTREDFAPR